jgi:hypothetical protein
MINFSAHRFYAVVDLAPQYDVLDLTLPADQRPPAEHLFSIGRYDEDRVIYTQDLFAGVERRTVHVGIDIGGPPGTAVSAFAAGTVLHVGYNPAEGDYGHALVTHHVLDGVDLYALCGHLAASVLDLSPSGRVFEAGELLAEFGAESENGGWPPHLHFQLAWERPETHDMPGVVTGAERLDALQRYPDPRLVLGPLY